MEPCQRFFLRAVPSPPKSNEPLQVEEAPGPMHSSGAPAAAAAAGGGPLESGGGDKTKPFVQNAVTVQDEDVGAGAPSRPASAVPVEGAPRGDGGLVRKYSSVNCRCCSYFLPFASYERDAVDALQVLLIPLNVAWPRQ